MKGNFKKFLAIVITFSLILSLMAAGTGVVRAAGSEAGVPLSDPFFVKSGPQATSLTVLDLEVNEDWRGGNGDTAMAAGIGKVIQGLVNRTSSDKIYLERDCYDTHDMAGPWWNFQETMRQEVPELSGLPTTTITRMEGADGGLKRLLTDYGSYVKGLVIWDSNSTNGVNAATYAAAITISGLKDAIPVSPAMKAQIEGWGFNFPTLVDLRENNFLHDYDVFNYMIDTYQSQINQNQKAVFVIMEPMVFGNESALDYIVATKSFAYSCEVSGNQSAPEGDAALIKLLHKYNEGEVAIVGWGNQKGGGEVPYVIHGTSYFDIGQEGASNFSVWASFPDTTGDMPDPVASPVKKDDVYIAFGLSDADTLHCSTLGLFSEYTRLKEEHWGQVPVSFGMNPILVNFAPPLYKYFVNNLPAGSDIYAEYADKGFEIYDSKSDVVNEKFINPYAKAADFKFTHTVWGSTEGGANSNFIGIWQGYVNTRTDATISTLNPNTMVIGDWGFGSYGSRMADDPDYVRKTGDGVRNYANRKGDKPVFMILSMGWQGARRNNESSYIAAANIKAELLANSDGRNYHFVSTRDLAATYNEWIKTAGPQEPSIPFGSERVYNGSFELNPVGDNGWGVNNWGGTPTFTWANDYAHSGTYSAKISGSNMTSSNYTQMDIEVSPDTEVELSGWVKTDNLTGEGAKLVVQELDSVGNGIPWYEGGYIEVPYPNISGTTDGWTQIKYRWKTNSKTVKTFIRCMVNGTGTAWFDDISLINGIPGTDATLSDLKVNGVTVNGFVSNKTTYDVVLPAGTTAVPTVTAALNDENATIMSVIPPAVLPGTAEVNVRAQDNITIKTYKINFTVAAPNLNSNADLSSLKVDGTTITGFDPYNTTYTVVLPAGTTTVPEVLATVADTGKANAVVTPATSLPGVTKVVVTAENGTTIKTYAINFTFEKIIKPLIKVEPLVVPVGEAREIDLSLKNTGVELLGGSIELKDPSGKTLTSDDASFSLPAGESKNFKFNFDYIGKADFNEYNVQAFVKDNSGNLIYQDSFPLDFTVTKVTDKAVTIDGSLEDWKDAYPVHIMYPYQSSKGNIDLDNLSATAYTIADDKNYYFAVKVRDNVHSQLQAGGGIWNGDNLQISIDPMNDKSVRSYSGDDYEIGFALSSNNNTKSAYTWVGADPYMTETANYEVVRNENDKTTIYEIAVPKEKIPQLSTEEGKLYGLDFCINDADTASRDCIYEYTPGIGLSKDPSQYKSWVMKKIAEAPVFDRTGDQTVDEGKPLTFDVTASDENGDALAYSATGLPEGATFDAATGKFAWTPGFDQAGSYTIAFQVSDGSLTDNINVSITVRNVAASELTAGLANYIKSLSIDRTKENLLVKQLEDVASFLEKGQYKHAATKLKVFMEQAKILSPKIINKDQSEYILQASLDAVLAIKADAQGKDESWIDKKVNEIIEKINKFKAGKISDDNYESVISLIEELSNIMK